MMKVWLHGVTFASPLSPCCEMSVEAPRGHSGPRRTGAQNKHPQQAGRRGFRRPGVQSNKTSLQRRVSSMASESKRADKHRLGADYHDLKGKIIKNYSALVFLFFVGRLVPLEVIEGRTAQFRSTTFTQLLFLPSSSSVFLSFWG